MHFHSTPGNKEDYRPRLLLLCPLIVSKGQSGTTIRKQDSENEGMRRESAAGEDQGSARFPE